MPSRCVAAGCSNTTKNGVSVHKFPADPKFRRIWTANVKLTRAKWSGRSEQPMLCSAHFESSCFERGLHNQFGIKYKAMLLPDAVPTIFPVSKKAGEKEKRPEKRRGAFWKREKLRTLQGALRQKRKITETVADVGQMRPDSDTHRMSIDQGDQPETHMEILAQAKDAACQTEPVHVAPLTGTSFLCVDAAAQTSTELCAVAIDCKLLDDRKEVEAYDEEMEEETHVPASPDKSPAYIPPSSSSDSSEPHGAQSVKRRGRNPRTVHNPSDDTQPQNQLKYIVCASELLKLFRRCFKCRSRNVSITKRTVGTFISITQQCDSCTAKEATWESQPWFGALPSGNIMLSAAILFAGASPSQVFRVLNSVGIATHSLRSFFNHQKSRLMPAVEMVWSDHIQGIKRQLKAAGEPLILGGDGRADSPGHSAKFGSYSTIELKVNKIVDIQLVQCNEVKSSYHMEMEGFKRMVTTLGKAELTIGKLVTDRHRSLAKYIREQHPSIEHMYDVWHIAKGIKKKVRALAQKKGYECIGEWQRSINNHVYWCASSTTDSEEDLRQAKWESLSNHIVGIHKGHSDLYPKCNHRTIRRKKKWLKPGAEATVKLNDVLGKTSLLKDIRKMSTSSQTSSVESFHSLINQFAPKSKAFSYEGMNCRLHLAGLHYNQNSERAQAVTSKGTAMYHLSKPKFKPGEAAVKPLKDPASFGYVTTLFTEVIRRCKYSIPSTEAPVIPPAMSAKYKFPNKDDLIKHHRSRFNII